MLILITKDSATVVAREVKDMDEARGFESRGFSVQYQDEAGAWVPIPPAEAAEAVEAAPAPVDAPKNKSGK